MSGGGKGGGQTTETKIPSWIQGPAQRNLQRAEQLSKIGYMGNYGPQVAAFTPAQLQSMQATGSQAQAFGLAPFGFNATAGIPTPETFAGGIQGYSSGNLFDQAVAELAARQPEQYAAQQRLFIGPTAPGSAPSNNSPYRSPFMGLGGNYFPYV